MMNKTLVMSAALVALTSASAQAQTYKQARQAQPYQQQEQQVRVEKKSNIEITPYFGIRGIASFQKSKFNGTDDSGNPDNSSENFDNAGLEVAVGTKITDNFRAEFAYTYRGGSSKETTEYDAGEINYNKIEPTVQSFMINGYVDLPTAAKVRPYLGVGVGLGKAKYEHTFDYYDGSNWTHEKDHASKTKFAYSLSAGLTYEATSALSWDLGYRYADFGSFTKEDSKIKTRAHEVVIGARFAFK